MSRRGDLGSGFAAAATEVSSFPWTVLGDIGGNSIIDNGILGTKKNIIRANPVN